MAIPSAGPKRSCFMAQGLYLKANGEMPCWDDVGEAKILRKLDPDALANGGEGNIASFEELLRIRSAFANERYPNPGLCERCAVKDAGLPVTSLRPSLLEVLHVEPSYLCHLSCPQCVPQKLRKSLKDPPYHLTPEMYEGFLKALHADGIDQVRLVIFEGRGDPFSSPHMETIIRLTKSYYPEAITSLTTHGSFPPKPWVVESGLDILRFSVDGAFQENYQKYRIGGKLDTIFKFMRTTQELKSISQSRLYIEWKYILFEWNDSDDELCEASRLAEELGARLRLCRTHTPGRSQVYPHAQDVDAMIRRLGLKASQDLTFQLKEDRDFAEVIAVQMEQLRGALSFASSHHAENRIDAACDSISDVLLFDGLAKANRPVFADYAELAAYLKVNVTVIRTQEAASGLARFANQIGCHHLIAPLLRHYLQLAPATPDRMHIEADINVRVMLELEAAGDNAAADQQARNLIQQNSDDTDDLMAHLGRALKVAHPGVVVGLANIYEKRGCYEGALLLFDRYLALAPQAEDASNIKRHIRALVSYHFGLPAAAE